MIFAMSKTCCIEVDACVGVSQHQKSFERVLIIEEFCGIARALVSRNWRYEQDLQQFFLPCWQALGIYNSFFSHVGRHWASRKSYTSMLQVSHGPTLNRNVEINYTPSKKGPGLGSCT